MSSVRSWSSPSVPALPAGGLPPRIRDTVTGELTQPIPGQQARIYVCGITPYDSTHLGHAATYIAFDTLVRAWKDAGLQVSYVQNVTDIDDPLLQRAAETGADWSELARDQVGLYTSDMAALRVLAPDHFIGVVEMVEEIAQGVAQMLAAGSAYQLQTDDAQGPDTYALMSADPLNGSVGNLSEEQMDRFFAERGGDPQVPGKEHPRDALLWRAARPGEPVYDGGPLGPGRPGWHIECAVIAQHYLGVPFHVQGGGSDLIYPHHEMSTSHLRMTTGQAQPAGMFLHTGLVAYQGEKMSKSLGNLVFVSELLTDVAPAVIRLAVLANHYATDWEYTPQMLQEAEQRYQRWQAALHRAEAAAHDGDSRSGQHDQARAGGFGGRESQTVLTAIREALSNDLDTPAALTAVDTWASSETTAADAAVVADAVDALLGVDLRQGTPAVVAG